MAELVNQVCEENRIAKLGRPDIEDFGPANTNVAELWVPGLLRPPRIESLFLDMSWKDGHLDGQIFISTSEYFGVMNVFVAIEDEQGNPIESDYAVDTNGEVENFWGYAPSAPLPCGTTIVVRAIAMDALGGVGIQTERIMVKSEADQQVA
jgi:hypothetical protein